ncbi:MAG: Rrf2 family transcriptional regulator [Planctomycetes bacterium]|nr:Rrf2 family transcriptional regulator [Planctomycetota bacterium]
MLSTTSEYALRIMIALTEAGGDSMTTEQIGNFTNVPVDYAGKVLQWLGRAQLVRGRRGRGGGFKLSCDPNATSLLDIVNVIDPLQRITSCPLERDQHKDKLCALHRRIDEVIAQLEDSLRSMTLTSVVEEGDGEPSLCQPSNNGGESQPGVSNREVARQPAAGPSQPQ